MVLNHSDVDRVLNALRTILIQMMNILKKQVIAKLRGFNSIQKFLDIKIKTFFTDWNDIIIELLERDFVQKFNI